MFFVTKEFTQILSKSIAGDAPLGSPPFIQYCLRYNLTLSIEEFVFSRKLQDTVIASVFRKRLNWEKVK